MTEEISKLLKSIETRLKNLQLELNSAKRDIKDNSENFKQLESRLNTIEAEINAESEFIEVIPEVEIIRPNLEKSDSKPKIPGHQISER